MRQMKKTEMPKTEMPVLELCQGSVSYPDGKQALKQVSAAFYPGEKVAVIGSNGAGKSTFFQTLNRITCLNEGELYCHGKLCTDKRKDILELRKCVGIVFQDPDRQIIASTVEGEISFGLFPLGKSEEEIRQLTGKIMERMQLAHLADRPPHFLSGGEKKQVSIASVAVMKPEVLLFDEPTASLDWKNTVLFKEQLKQLEQERVTLMISTHDMDFVWEWAERVLVFSEGELLADDVPEVIFGNQTLLEQASLRQPFLYLLPGHPKTIEAWKETEGKRKEANREENQ